MGQYFHATMQRTNFSRNGATVQRFGDNRDFSLRHGVKYYALRRCVKKHVAPLREKIRCAVAPLREKARCAVA